MDHRNDFVKNNYNPSVISEMEEIDERISKSRDKEEILKLRFEKVMKSMMLNSAYNGSPRQTYIPW